MRFLSGIIYAVIIVVLCAATFIEHSHGTRFATDNIYHSAWFICLWAMLAVASSLIIVRKRLWRRAAVFSLHLSFFLILIGAATTFFTSRSGVLHIREGYTENSFVDDNRQLQTLPFSLTLDSFRIKHYPGTETPADYISYVKIIPHSQTLLTPHSSLHTPKRSTLISMNNILCHDGHRFYQSSYDEDLKGTLLTVKYDPWGTPVTYIGYTLMALSMIWVLCARKERFRRLLRQTMEAKPLLIATLFIYGVQMSARSLPTINDDKAREMARRQIVYNGRIVPFSTMAHDFMLKIYGKTSYHGLSPEQVVCGWMGRPGTWKNEPMIKVNDRRLQEHLGANDGYVALQSLFSGDGSYKLTSHDASRSIRDLDEKVGVIIMLTQGSLFTSLPKDAVPLSSTRVEAEILYNRLPVIKVLFMLNLAVGIISLIFFTIKRNRHKTAIKLTSIVFCISLVFLAAFYVLRWYISGHVPLGNGYETMLFMSLVIMLVSAFIGRRFILMLPMGLLLSGLTLLVAHLSDSNPQITHLMPVLNSPLLTIHVSVIMMAYALLAMTFIISLVGLFTPHCTPYSTPHSTPHSTLHTPHSLSLLCQTLLYPAEFLLAAGIFIGAVWANVSWGTYWSWDPKEVWALITMLIYAIPFHTPHSTLQKPFFLFMIFAFLTVLMTYFGVNFFLGGMHSYAN